MIYAISLAFTRHSTEVTNALDTSDLRRVGAVAGCDVLKYLDGKMRPKALRKCAKEDLQTLFLLVLGTTLAISYIVPASTNEVSYLPSASSIL